MNDQVFEAAVRSKIAKLENMCDNWRKEAVGLEREVAQLREQLAACQKERDAFQNQCIRLRLEQHRKVHEEMKNG